MINTFSFVFISVLALTIVLRFWLSSRQMAHVKAHRDAVPPQFADAITLSAHQKAADYTGVRTRFGLFSLIIETLVLLAFTFGGALQWLSDFWSLQFSGLTYGVLLILSVTFISGLIDLPMSLYTQFVIEEKFGFNRMTVKLFFTDLIKQTVIGLIIGIPVIFAVLWMMDRMGAYWWFYVWVFWSVFNLLILFIYPMWIAPLFNKFSPLEDEALSERIEKLLKRCGFSVAGLFVMDGSKRSGHGNAYFTGFGSSKRIVFFDTLLNRLQHSEIEAVLAHELGHFKHRHIVKRIVVMFVLSLGFLALLGQLMQAPWFYEALGVQTQNTALALILFFLIMPVFTFVLTPIMSYFSRQHEFEADRYAAQQASPEALIKALVKLYEDNAATLTPDPVHSMFYDSHPPAAIRIARLS